MSRRTRSRNRFQSQLTAGIAAGVASFAIDSAAGLDDPCYLVISPKDPLKTEFIRVATITGTTLSGVTRNLAGSVGDIAHDAGEPVRAVAVHQWIDDIFDDIEDLEADTTNLAAADTAHFGGSDIADHPEATGSVRGFMSAADKTKLDGISGGAVSDHGALSGLGDDDHPQYLTPAEAQAMFYPVGSLYFQAGVATNPATLLGFGTWAAFGAGRMLVGFNAADTDFDTLEETGGSKAMLDHTHNIGTHVHSIGTHTHPVNPPDTVTTTDPPSLQGIPAASGLGGTGAGFHDHNVNIAQFNSGSNVAENTAANADEASGVVNGTNPSQMNPYIVVHIWKRTA